MIIRGDCLEWLRGCEETRVIFADPPDNLGLRYREFVDRRDDYQTWMEELVRRALDKCQVLWLSYNQVHDLWLSGRVDRIVQARLGWQPWLVKKIIWRYTFGQYNSDGFASGYRPILLFGRVGVNLNYDAIRVTSERMRLGDQRAQGLRIPDDVWEYSRVVGNAKERRNWIPTQHPEALIERIVLLSCTLTEDGHTKVKWPFVDLFLGSGTSGRVCNRLGVPWTGIEISQAYCEKLRAELK